MYLENTYLKRQLLSYSFSQPKVFFSHSAKLPRKRPGETLKPGASSSEPLGDSAAAAALGWGSGWQRTGLIWLVVLQSLFPGVCSELFWFERCISLRGQPHFPDDFLLAFLALTFQKGMCTKTLVESYSLPSCLLSRTPRPEHMFLLLH